MKNQQNVIIWGAWYGSGNVGDQALLLSIANLLNESFNNLRLVIITANPFLVKENTNRDTIVDCHPISPKKNFLDMILEFSRADYLIFGGGVPFYDDTSHTFATLFLVVVSIIFRVPIILWCVSSQVIKRKFTRLVLGLLVRYSKVLTCRDNHTFQLLLECGADPENLQIIAVSVFTINIPKENTASREMINRASRNSLEFNEKELIALTPRLLRGQDGEAHTHYSPKNKLDWEKELNVYASVLDWLWEAGYQPIFVPMNTIAPDDDRTASKLVMEGAKYGRNAWLVDEFVPPLLAAGIYRECKAGLVSRVHGSVTAFLGGCPVVMYAFDKKHVGIMAQIGTIDQIFDPELDNPQDAIRKINEIIISNKSNLTSMQSKLTELQKSARIPIHMMQG